MPKCLLSLSYVKPGIEVLEGAAIAAVIEDQDPPAGHRVAVLGPGLSLF